MTIKIPRQDQTIKTKQDFPKQRKKFYQKVGGECEKTYHLLDVGEATLFWSTIWERIDHNKKIKWINNMEKELREFEVGPLAKIHLDSLKAILKKVPN